MSARYYSKNGTILTVLRRSRSLVCTTMLTTLLSLLGPLVPHIAYAQSTTPTPVNPGNPGVGLSSAGIQQGQTGLGIPETGAAAALQPNWSVDPSTGSFSASVPFVLPRARGSVQPSLALV